MRRSRDWLEFMCAWKQVYISDWGCDLSVSSGDSGRAVISNNCWVHRSAHDWGHGLRQIVPAVQIRVSPAASSVNNTDPSRTYVALRYSSAQWNFFHVFSILTSTIGFMCSAVTLYCHLIKKKWLIVLLTGGCCMLSFWLMIYFAAVFDTRGLLCNGNAGYRLHPPFCMFVSALAVSAYHAIENILGNLWSWLCRTADVCSVMVQWFVTFHCSQPVACSGSKLEAHTAETIATHCTNCYWNVSDDKCGSDTCNKYSRVSM
jgi:hypothetical protein